MPDSPSATVSIPPLHLAGDLTVPPDARGLVIFAHGSGSSRLSPRNQEVAHALARTGEVAREVGKGGDVVLLMSGRGDKDIFQVAKHLGVNL